MFKHGEIAANKREAGQSVVEFAMVLPILLVLVSGIVDMGLMFTSRIAVENAARNGVRYATTHPTAWSTADPAPDTSIEGVIQQAGGTSSIPNDDAHITISYLYPNGSACGHFSVSSGFVGSESSCVVPGNLIEVQVSTGYSILTPVIRTLFSDSIQLSGSATMVEEQ